MGKPVSSVAGRRPRWSVRAYLFLIAGAACVLLVASGTISTYLHFSDARNQALDASAREAELIATDIEKATEAALTSVVQSVATPGLAAGLEAPAENCNLSSGSSGVDLHLISRDGGIFCSSVEGAAGHFSYKDVDLGLSGSEQDVTISDPFVDPVASDRSVALAAPVLNEQGQVAGSFAAVVHLDVFAEQLKTVTSARRDMEITLIHEDSGEFLSSSEIEGIGGRSIEGTAFEEAGRTAREGLDQDRRLYASSSVEAADWRVVVGTDEESALSIARSALWRRVIQSSTILALLLALIVVIYRRIARPLENLSAKIREAGEAPTPAPIETSGPAEISHLTEEFNAMLHARTEYESRLVEAQKMEAVGQLAGGIAHDFNNLLAAVISYGHLLGEQLEGDPRQEDAHQIVSAAERGTALVRRLLTFSRREVSEPRIISIPTAVGSAAKLLRQMIREDIVLDFDLDPNCWNVLIDPVEFDQALVNLVVNARDAMPRGGRIAVAARNTTVHVREPNGPMPGDYVALTVSDTGEGIDPSIKGRIFEPFFTTKPAEHGSGLGLSVVYGVVKKAGGTLQVTSEVGKGTAFTILLPREVRDEVEQEVARTGSGSRAGEATILVVEDEEMVRQSTVRLLEKYNYTVLSADSGREALNILRSGAKADLLLTDLVMPKMSGTSLAEKAGLPVLFMSGYVDSHLRNAGLTDLTNHIEKPFAPGDLVAAIERVLVTSRNQP